MGITTQSSILRMWQFKDTCRYVVKNWNFLKNNNFLEIIINNKVIPELSKTEKKKEEKNNKTFVNICLLLDIHCYGLNYVPSNIHMLKPQHPVPQNVTEFGKGTFKGVTELKWDH